MIAVLFEAEIKPGAQDRYLMLAAELKPRLAQLSGFIDIERFQSLSAEGKVLSLSWWRDEAAVLAWKQDLQHRAAQEEGKASLFASYRIRIVALQREYAHHV